MPLVTVQSPDGQGREDQPGFIGLCTAWAGSGLPVAPGQEQLRFGATSGSWFGFTISERPRTSTSRPCLSGEGAPSGQHKKSSCLRKPGLYGALCSGSGTDEKAGSWEEQGPRPERAPSWVRAPTRTVRGSRPSLYPPAPPAHSLGLMDSRGTVMLASESSVAVGGCRGPGGSGDAAWRRPVALELGELQLPLFCRSRSVSRGAGCCFSLVGGCGIGGVNLWEPRDQGHRKGRASWLSLMASSDTSLSLWPWSPHFGTGRLAPLPATPAL